METEGLLQNCIEVREVFKVFFLDKLIRSNNRVQFFTYSFIRLRVSKKLGDGPLNCGRTCISTSDKDVLYITE